MSGPPTVRGELAVLLWLSEAWLITPGVVVVVVLVAAVVVVVVVVVEVVVGNEEDDDGNNSADMLEREKGECVGPSGPVVFAAPPTSERGVVVLPKLAGLLGLLGLLLGE